MFSAIPSSVLTPHWASLSECYGDNLQCISLEDCQVYFGQLDVTTSTFRVLLSKENSWLVLIIH